MIHLLPVIVVGAGALLCHHQFLNKVRSEILFNNKKNEDKGKNPFKRFPDTTIEA